MVNTNESQRASRFQSQVQNAIDQGHWMSALEICQQWIVADPENPDGFFKNIDPLSPGFGTDQGASQNDGRK